MEIKITRTPDFDYNVEDIAIVIDGVSSWIKGFDDTEWKEANEFGTTLAKALGVPFELGEEGAV